MRFLRERSPGRSAAILVLAVLLLGVGAPVAGTARGPGPALDPSADSTSQGVNFTLNLLPSGSVAVALAFTATAGLTGGTISPGQSVTAVASLVLPPTINLSITYGGITTGVPVAAVGNSFDVPVPGLSLAAFGVPLGVFLNFSSEVTATSTVSGPGSGGGGSLNWTSSKSDSFSISANASAPPGSTITSTLGNLQYSVALGLDAGANIPILGAYVIHLIQFGHLGLVNGNPSTVHSTYLVPVPSSTGGLAANGASTLLLVGGLVLLVVAVAVVVLFARRRRRVP